MSFVCNLPVNWDNTSNTQDISSQHLTIFSKLSADGDTNLDNDARQYLGKDLQLEVSINFCDMKVSAFYNLFEFTITYELISLKIN